MLLATTAFGDNVDNDVQSTYGSENVAYTAGDAPLPVYFWIDATGGNGCDAADGSSAVITISAPSAVIVAPASRTFTSCGMPAKQSFSFSTAADATAGQYDIEVNVTDSIGNYNANGADFHFVVSAEASDGDGDGVADDDDNCVDVANSDQADADNDGVGDACEADTDGDGVVDDTDNCDDVMNVDQADLDNDGLGDLCDSDKDGDSVLNDDDNCPVVANTNQADADSDGIGDACDPDNDNDGIANGTDNCEFVANPLQEDLDADGLGDACDPDIDGDGVLNTADNCPVNANADQADADSDGLGNVCDPNAYAPVVSDEAEDATDNEGTSLTASGAFTDQDADAVMTITHTGAGDLVDNGDGTWSWSLATTDDGSGTVTVTVKDNDDEHSTTDTFNWTATDVKPALSALVVTGNGTACIGPNTVGLSFSFTSASVDTISGLIAWGDGTTTSFSSSPVSTSHNYSAGTYNITVSLDDEDALDPLSPDDSDTAGVSLLYNATGVLQPVNDTQAHQDPSIFKYGNTIPVKIRITDCNGTSVSGVAPMISVSKVSSTTPSEGVLETISNTNSPDANGIMRYDAAGALYIYNLATKSLSDGTARYRITITGPFAPINAEFGLKTK
jgi:hypothetical protein